MATFAQMKTAISARLQDENNVAISAANVGSAINDAIGFWSKRRFWFNQTQSTSTLTVGNPIIPGVPTNILYLIPESGLVIVDSQIRYVLTPVLSFDYDMENIEGLGRPYIYVFRNNQYEVYFYPDQDYTVLFNYIKSYAPLVLEADENDFTNKAELLIRYWALAMLYEEFMQDTVSADRYRLLAENEFASLSRQTSTMIGSGELVVYD